MAGYGRRRSLEVVKRTLRVRDQGPWHERSAGEDSQIAVPTQTAPIPAPPRQVAAATPMPSSPKAAAAVQPKLTPVAVAETKPAPAPPPVETTKPVVPVQPAAPPPFAAADGSVKERILALVVEKTGYPEEMLELDLDLEADLGVDTVKQAELFAAIRETYGIPRDENVKLRDYPTLAHVIRFVYEKRPDLADVGKPASNIQEAATAPVAATSAASAPSCQLRRRTTVPSSSAFWR